jgi:hypothetical protein
MKNRFRFSLFLIAFIASAATFAQTDDFESIGKAFKASSAAEMATHFNSRVELSVPGSDDAYSKAQAEMILKDFFAKNPAKNFSTNHKGSSGAGTRFMNGTLETSNGTYKVYVVLKGNMINELRIEHI